MSSAADSNNASAAAAPRPQRVVIVPGNGCANIEAANWYVPVANELRDTYGCDVRVRSMPDPVEAKRSIWLPFILNELGADEETVLIGHSSGAVAALRLLESHKLKGAILVSACHTDLGMESEAISGYYPHADGSNPWNWEAIKSNAQWIAQLHSEDDPFIDPSEARFVAKHIGSEYVEHKERGHYMTRDMPDVIDIVVKKCGPKKKE
jgi:predicted alpha/beta hydrolase family esterase